MAGAAIFGIVTAILRLPAIGAPIQYISVGEKLSVVPAATTGDLILQSTTPDWYDYNGVWGQGISLVMFLGLAVVCFLLAKKGADGFVREEDAEEKDGT